VALPRALTSGGQLLGRAEDSGDVSFFCVSVAAEMAAPMDIAPSDVGVAVESPPFPPLSLLGPGFATCFLVALAQVCQLLHTLHGLPFSSRTTPGGSLRVEAAVLETESSLMSKAL